MAEHYELRKSCKHCDGTGIQSWPVVPSPGTGEGVGSECYWCNGTGLRGIDTKVIFPISLQSLFDIVDDIKDKVDDIKEKVDEIKEVVDEL